MLSSAGEAFTRAQRDKEAFFGSFQDDSRAFLGAQIDATLVTVLTGRSLFGIRSWLIAS